MNGPPARPTDGPDWDLEVRRHGRRVVMTVVAIGLRLDRAEEVAQTAWGRIVAKFQSGELTKVELPGLVIKQARFLALDELRRLQKEQARRVLNDEVTLVDRAANPEVRAVDKDQLERALAAVASRSDAGQRVFRAVYAEPGRAHREVAEELGISVQRVRQTLCEVRRQVRAALEENEND